VWTYNKEGDVGTMMGTGKEGGSIFTNNKNGHSLVDIFHTQEGHGGIWVYDREGKNHAFYGHEK